MRTSRADWWPHRVSFKTAMFIAVAVSIVRLGLLAGAAWLDTSLVLPDNGTGLLSHPGALSIVFGDLILFALCVQCVGMSRKIGARLPTTRTALTRRYFRARLWRDVFGGKHRFLTLFVVGSIVGSLAVVNQSIKLFDAPHHYGHDTFDSSKHLWSFAAQRISLTISWCIVVPLFVSYALIHIHCLRTIAQMARKKALSTFLIQHPDKSGGYGFFGIANLLYSAGSAVILLEVFLLGYTHKTFELANVFAFALGTGIFLFVTVFAIWEIRKTIKALEVDLKTGAFRATSKGERPIDTYHLLLNYNVRFSAYNFNSAYAITLLRALSAILAIYRVWEFRVGF